MSVDPDLIAEKDAQILLVIPDDTLSQQCRSLIEEKGYSVLMASSGTEGLDCIYRHLPDLVVVFIQQADINGYQLCRLVKNDPTLQKIPVLILSPFDKKIDRFWGFKAGADGFVETTALEEDLLEQMDMLLEIYDRIEIEEKERFLSQRPTPSTEDGLSDPFSTKTRLNQILDKALIESTVMIEFRNLCDLAHDRNLLNHMLFSLMESLIDYDLLAIVYFEKNRDPYCVSFHIPEHQNYPKTFLESLKEEFIQEVLGSVSDPENTTAWDVDKILMETIGALDDTVEPAPFPSKHIKTFVSEEGTLGAMALYSHHKVHYPQIFPLHLVEDEIQLLMKLRVLYSYAELIAVIDPLTGVYNYRSFIQILEREFHRAKRYEMPLTMAFIELQNLDELNDQHSYLLGDALLRLVAQETVHLLRNVDIVARYSGRRLVVLFPDTPLENAEIACQRLLETYKASPLDWEGLTIDVQVAVSADVLEETTLTPNQFIYKTEKKLLNALSDPK